MVPCGAQAVDLSAHVGWRYTLNQIYKGRLFSAISSSIDMITQPKWLAIHTESRYLDEFNEQGWNRCYLLIAAILKKSSNLRGMVGSSWFYDPQLNEISPRLSYLQRVPLSGGATHIRCDSSSSDIALATRTSPTRAKLYEEGKYTPVRYTIAWPRKELIEWAEKQKEEERIKK